MSDTTDTKLYHVYRQPKAILEEDAPYQVSGDMLERITAVAMNKTLAEQYVKALEDKRATRFQYSIRELEQ